MFLLCKHASRCENGNRGDESTTRKLSEQLESCTNAYIKVTVDILLTQTNAYEDYGRYSFYFIGSDQRKYSLRSIFVVFFWLRPTHIKLTVDIRCILLTQTNAYKAYGRYSSILLTQTNAYKAYGRYSSILLTQTNAYKAHG